MRLRIGIATSVLAYAAMLPLASATLAASAPKLIASPPAISFGSELVLPPLGVSKTKSATLSVSRTASGPVTVSSIVSPDPQFAPAQPNPCPSIAPGGKCQVPIVFTPSKVGKQGPVLLTITSNATNSTLTIKLTGIGRQGKLTINPTSVSFGKVVNGFASAAHGVTLTNNNPLALNLDKPSIDNPVFQIQSNNCPATVAANGGNCQLSLVFVPQKPGAQKGTVSATGNFVKGAVHLTGIGKSGPTPTPTPTGTGATPTPTAAGGPTPTPTPTATSSGGATPTPTPTSIGVASPTPTASPIASPTPLPAGMLPYAPVLN